MKKHPLILLVLFSLLTFSGCSSTDSPSNEPFDESYSEWEEETYTITFVSNDEVVKVYEDVSYGDYVDIPTVTPISSRYTLKGWVGIDDESYQNGKIMVYETDATYVAMWKETFGTDNVFEATRLKTSDQIKVDGIKDDCYSQTETYKINQVVSGETSVNADLSMMWDESNLYLFLEVEDGSDYPYQNGGEINDFDSLNLFLDLLHDDYLSALDYVDGWGGVYRGEPGPMCEGWFKIARGANYPKDGFRYGDDSLFMWEGWLSNAARESGKTIATTYQTSKGYNVEYLIDCTNPNIPSELQLNEGNTLGVGLQIYDKSDNAQTNVVCLEEVNKDMIKSPKKLSNVQLVANEDQSGVIFSATKVRDGYEVSTKDKCDNLFKDAKVNYYKNNSFKILFDENNLYLYSELDSETSQIKLESDSFDDVIINKNGKTIINVNSLTSESVIAFDVEINRVKEEINLVLNDNPNSITPSRKLFTSNYVEEELTIDGNKDDAYSTTEKIDININSLVEANNLTVTAEAYVLWDDSYLYIFVDVKDDNVDSTTVNTQSPEKNDSVEIWLSTCQSLPDLSTKWGYSKTGNFNRLEESYCGELKYARRAGNPDSPECGAHWMWDNNEVYKQSASTLTSTGYTCEFKIGLASFKDKVVDKENEIIDLTINVNDGEDSLRKGIVSTNYSGHLVCFQPGYFDHIKLVNK